MILNKLRKKRLLPQRVICRREGTVPVRVPKMPVPLDGTRVVRVKREDKDYRVRETKRPTLLESHGCPTFRKIGCIKNVRE